LIDKAEKIARLGYEASPYLDDTLSKAEQELVEVRVGYPTETDRVLTHENTEGYFLFEQDVTKQMLEEGTGWLNTGWKEFDSIVRLRNATTTVIAGPSSMGKTTFVECLLDHAAKDLGKNGVLYFNELNKYQLLCRRACRYIELGIERKAPLFRDVEDGKLRNNPAMHEWLNDFSEWPGKITMVDATGWSVFKIAADMRQKAAMGLLDFAIVDYLQLIPRENVSKRDTTDARAIGIIMTHLKNTCLDLSEQPPLIVVSQVARGINKKDDCHQDKLRDSGEIGEYSNQVVIVFNEWDATKGKCAEKCEYCRGTTNPGQCWRRCLWACTVKNTFGEKGDVRLNQFPWRYKIIEVGDNILPPKKTQEDDSE